MDIVAALHRLAGWLAPAGLAAVAILLAVAATLLPGVRRRRAGPAARAGLALLALGTIPAFGPWPWPVNLGLVVAVAALGLAHLRGEPPECPIGGEAPPVRIQRVVLAATLALTALLVVPGLGTYSGSLLIWECEVVDGFAAAFRDGLAPLALLGRNLLWTDGAVSEGFASLIYGGATYPLLLEAGFTVAVLRAVAAACGLLTVPLLYLQARRWLTPGAAVLATAAWSLSTTALLYARYGTSLSATLATLLLATLAVGAVRARGTTSWWPAPLAAGALAVASLHYAPGRLVVLLLLVAAANFLARDARRLTRAGAAGALLAALLLGAFVALQLRNGRAGLFFNAHGEHLLGIARHPQDVAAYLGRPPRVGRPTAADAVAVGAVLVHTNLPSLGRLAGVAAWRGPVTQPGRRALQADPPQIPLYFLPLLPFLVLGAVSSLRRWRTWPHALLLAWTGVTVGAALLSNRVDHHRLVTLCIPLCLWLGAGLANALGLLRRAGLPRAVCTALLGALAVAALLEAVWLLNRPRPVVAPPLVVSAALALRDVDGPVTAAFVAEVRDRTAVELLLLERDRALGLPPHESFHPGLQEVLQDGNKRPHFGKTLVVGLGNAVGRGALLLGPTDDTLTLALGLQANGFWVRRVDGPAALFVVTAPPGGVSGP